LNACRQQAETAGGQYVSLTVGYLAYRVVPGHRDWQIETAGWNWAGIFTEGLETRWQRIG